MTLLLDRAINALKWPVGIVAFMLLPAVAPLFFHQVRLLLSPQYVGLWIGLSAYIVLHQAIFRRRFFGSWLPTLEHELTHALFAWMTLHTVGGLRLTWSKGGEIKVYGGRSNWLIVIAPYFFPTVPLAALALHAVWPRVFAGQFDVIMGVCLGFHLIATFKETRFEQPDLKKVGYLFSILLLPTANALGLAWVLSAVTEEPRFWQNVVVEAEGVFQYIGNLIGRSE